MAMDRSADRNLWESVWHFPLILQHRHDLYNSRLRCNKLLPASQKFADLHREEKLAGMRSVLRRLCYSLNFLGRVYAELYLF